MSDLRERLERESEQMVRPPDFADRMFERGRRRERNRRATALGVGVALFFAVLAIIMAALPDANRQPRPAEPTPTSPESVEGQYSVQLPAGDDEVRRLGMTGTYTMKLSAAGEMSLSGPRRFDLPGDPITFEVAGDELTTDLFVGSFCSTNGTYRWVLGAESLVLEAREDSCQERGLLLTSRPWTVDSSQPPSDRLEGDWTATFSCEQMVRSVRRAPIAPPDVAFWARGIGEERGADDPRDPCSGAPEPLAYTLRFDHGRLLIFDADLVEGFDGAYELQGDSFTLRDGDDRNIIGSYRVAFRIDGDSVSFDLLGRASTDSFFVATWESAAFVRQP